MTQRILTDADITRNKAENLKEFPHHAVPPNPDGTPGQVYNCEQCDQRFTCPFSMDPYNTGSDCLASK